MTGVALSDQEAYGYLINNPDILKAIGLNIQAAKQHYSNYGANEGRSVGYFDPYSYISSNLDLYNSIGLSEQAAVNHFVLYGQNENRDIGSFNALAYLASNPDLAAAFGDNQATATEHYIKYGQKEQRTLDGFDALGYLASNADLVDIFGLDTSAATRHFVNYGRSEGRTSGNFDAASYLNENPDLFSAFGSDELAATQHYILYGRREGRSNGVDLSWQTVEEENAAALPEPAQTASLTIRDDTLTAAARNPNNRYSFSLSSLLANDSGSGLRVISLGNVSGGNGSVSVSNGSYFFTAASGATTVGTFAYTARDQQGKTGTGRVTFRIPAPPAAAAKDDRIAVGSRNSNNIYTISASSLLANDSGTGAQVVSVQTVSGGNGTAKLSNGTVTFTATDGSVTGGSFKYTIKDSYGQTSTASVALTIPAARALPLVPSVWVSNWVGTEGTGGTKPAKFYIRLAEAAAQDTVLTASLVGGAPYSSNRLYATIGDDVGTDATQKTVVIAKGSKEATVSFAVRSDETPEDAERFFLNISYNGTTVASSTGIVVDDDWQGDTNLAKAVIGSNGRVQSADGKNGNTFITSPGYPNHKGIDVQNSNTSVRSVYSPVAGIVTKVAQIGTSGEWYVKVRMPSTPGEAERYYALLHLEAGSIPLTEGQMIGLGTYVGQYRPRHAETIYGTGNHTHLEENTMATAFSTSDTPYGTVNRRSDGVVVSEVDTAGTNTTGQTIYNPNLSFAIQNSYRSLGDPGNTTQSARLLGALTGGQLETYQTLNNGDRSDYFKFDVVTDTTLSMRLSMNNRDSEQMKLTLYNGAGLRVTDAQTQPMSSEGDDPGTHSGVIRQTLSAGTYYAAVTWASDYFGSGPTISGDAIYRLRLSTPAGAGAIGEASAMV